jgi:hypothetical protein
VRVGCRGESFLKALTFSKMFDTKTVGCLKWSECSFEIFSNIKLIVRKNTLYSPLYGTTYEQLPSCLVHPQKKKIKKEEKKKKKKKAQYR